MSLKSGEGKSLKGLKSAQVGGQIDMRSILAALSTAGLILTNVTLQNITAWSGMMDDVIIGSIMPNNGTFTNLTVGMDQDGLGGKFIVYGNKATKIEYDENGQIISTSPGDSISWDPVTAVFSIFGNLAIRDSVRLGNIVIQENKVAAVAPVDGNVEIYPQSDKGYIYIGGNIAQNLPGIVQFDLAKTVSFDSRDTSIINSRNENIISTERGNISIITDAKSNINIVSIVHQLTTTAATVTVDQYGTKNEVDSIQIITGNTILKLTETTLENDVVRLIRVTTKEKTTLYGQPATKTTIVTTGITPATILHPEIVDTTTTTETTLDAQVPNDFIPLSGEYVTDISHSAIVTTATKHGLDVNDQIIIHSSNSIPSYDGDWTISAIQDDITFILPAIDEFIAATQAYFTTSRNGSINISAANQVRFEIGVPINFGHDSLTYRPNIEATTQNDLVLTANYIHSFDPIPTLHSDNNAESGDSGFTIEYINDNNSIQQGFFGRIQSTQNFTWIPSATIIQQNDGIKSVSGEKGTMDLKGLQIQSITGDPDITISTPHGTIYLNTPLPISVSAGVTIGTAGTIGQSEDGKNIVISSDNGNVAFDVPNGQIQIPENTTLTFSDTTSITGTPDGQLTITSLEAPVFFNSDISVPIGKNVNIGSATFSTTTSDLKLSGSNTINLAPNNAILIPDDVLLQIGDISKTGFSGHQGTLSGFAISDFNFFSGGNISTTAQGNLSFTASGGVTNLNSTHVYIPATAEIAWSDTNTYISTIPNSILNIHSENPVNVSSDNNVGIASSIINLSATTSVQIPTDIPIIFGDNNAKIFAVADDGQLHISNPNGVIIDKDLIISGGLTVYGPTSEITSTKIVLEDPIITLGNSDVPEYVKDRGVQFYYGNGKLGFMGFGQDNDRFYLIKNSTNTNEVFVKDTFGDLQVNHIYANLISSTTGLSSTSITGNPYLNINGSYIGLVAQEYISVPDSIPIQFGTSANSIYGTDNMIVLDSNVVNVQQGNLNVGTDTGEIIVGTESGNIHLGNSTVSTDGTNMYLTGASIVNIDAEIKGPSTIYLGATSLITDENGNFNISASSNNFIQLANQLQLSDSGFTLGNSNVYWDPSTENLVLSAPDFAMQTNILNAHWKGQIIETLYGGTGRANTWNEHSIVFIGSQGLSFDQDEHNFLYDRTTASFSIRTTSFEDTITIGQGNIDMLDNSSSIILRTNNIRTWSIGKSKTVVESFTISSLDENQTQNPFVWINYFGQIGFGKGESLYSLFPTLQGTEKYKFLFGSGDIYFTEPVSAIHWSANTYIKSNNDNELFFSALANSLSFTNNGYTLTANNIHITSQQDYNVQIGHQLAFTVQDSIQMRSNTNINFFSDADMILTSDGTLFLNAYTGSNFNISNGDFMLHAINEYIEATELLSLTANIISLTAHDNLQFNADNLTFASVQNLTFTAGGIITIDSTKDLILISHANLNIQSTADCTLNVGENASISVKGSLLLSCDSLNTNILHDADVTVTNLSITASSNLSMTCIEYDLFVSENATCSIGGNLSTTITGSKTTSANQMEFTSASLISFSSANQQITTTQQYLLTANTIDISTLANFSIHGITASTLQCDEILSIISQETLDLTGKIIDITASDLINVICTNGAINIQSGDTFSLNIANTSHISSVGNAIFDFGAVTLFHSIGSMTIESNDGIINSSANDYSIQTGTNFRINCGKDISILSHGFVSMNADSNISINSSGNILESAEKDVSIVANNGNMNLISNIGNILIKAVTGTLTCETNSDMLFNSNNTYFQSTNNISIVADKNYSNTVTGTIALTSTGDMALSTSGYFVVTSGSRIKLMASEVFTPSTIMLAEDSTNLSAALGGILTISSENQTKLAAPHVIVPNRLCFHHDIMTNICNVYQQWLPDSSNLDIVNNIGDINLKPIAQVNLANSIKIQFGSGGYIQGQGADLVISSLMGDITLDPGSKSLHLTPNTGINFGNITNIFQSPDGFRIQSATPILFQIPSITIPDHTPIIFGDESRKIVSDGDTLFITSRDLLSLESATVRIIGNLIVSKSSTFTIETETNFDSGIITVGGGEIRNITNMQSNPISINSTLITTNVNHNLRLGDTIVLIDTTPNIDGTYIVTGISRDDQFTIDQVFPTQPLQPGESIAGTVRTDLTENRGTDEGIQFNWHTGGVQDTSGARIGFFGFDRSTQRFIYIPQATRTNDIFQGTPGDFQMTTLYAENISASNIITPIALDSNAISGSNFIISGGNIDNTPVGIATPSTGTFTNLHVINEFTIEYNGIVENLNADLLDNYHASSFVLRDGSTPLTSDWNVGEYRIITAGLTDSTLTINGGIVLAGTNGKLETNNNIRFVDNIFTVPKIASFQLVGNIDANGNTLSNGVIESCQFNNGSINTSQFGKGNISASTFTTGTIASTKISTSNMDHSNFTQGNIDNTILTESSFTNGSISTGTMNDYTITNTSYSNGTIDNTTITGGTMTNTIISNVSISLSSFINGSLETVSISDANITNVTMTTGTISNITMNASTLTDVDISNSRIKDTNLDNITGTNSHFSTSTFVQGTIDSTAFTGGTISNSTNITNVSISSSTADSIQIHNSTLTNSNFSNGTITGSEFSNGTVSNTTMTTITASDMDITQSTIKNTDISDGTLTNLQGSNISLTTSSFIDGNIDNTSFANGNITSSVISNGTMDSNAFVNGSIETSNFTNGNISSCDINDCNISGSRLNDIDQTNSRITTSSFNNGTLDNNALTNSTFTKGDIIESYVENNVITQSTFTNGNVAESNISLETNNSLDVSRGSIIFAEDQINGDWIADGIADIDISGNSETVTNGMYRNDFAQDNSMLKADISGEPYSFTIPEETLIGRRIGENVKPLQVDTIQDMLDILTKSLYTDNSILKADTASNPIPVQIPEGTILGRLFGEQIAALTPEQIIQLIMNTEILYQYGAVLRDGHRTFPDGGKMTGLLYYSTERFAISTGQMQELDLNVETSYVSVNYSRAAGRLATLTLGRGFADGHRKIIVLSRIADPAILQVFAAFEAPETIDPYAFVFRYAGQSAILQWDTVLSKWLIIGSGCDVKTVDEIRNPNWMDDY
jgi:uncharacterized protein YjbI with pentapeptide repeats/uncharacterized protein (DUF2345 family)